MTTPEERERIDAVVERLASEIQILSDLDKVRLRVVTSPETAERLRTLSEDLRSLTLSHGT